jgi:hypothetical protein
MKRLLGIFAAAVSWAAVCAVPAAAVVTPTTTGYYSLQYDTANGTATMQLAGNFRLAASSTTLSTPTIRLSGIDGSFTTTIGTATVYGISASSDIVSLGFSSAPFMYTGAGSSASPGLQVGPAAFGFSWTSAGGMSAIATGARAATFDTTNGVSGGSAATGNSSLSKTANTSIFSAAATPAFTFVGNRNAGLGAAGTDKILLITNSQMALYVENNQYIGISSGLPQANLDINGWMLVRGSATINANLTVAATSMTLLALDPILHLVGTNGATPSPAIYWNSASNTNRWRAILNGQATDQGLYFYDNTLGKYPFALKANEVIQLNGSTFTVTQAGNIGILTASPQATLDVRGTIATSPGTTASTMPVPGCWTTARTSATAATTGLQTFITYPLAANTFTANGDQIEIVAIATFTATSQAKVLDIRFNGTRCSAGNTTSVRTRGESHCWITRRQTNDQYAYGYNDIGAGNRTDENTLPAATESGAINVTVVGSSAAGLAGDVTMNMFRICYYRGAGQPLQ